MYKIIKRLLDILFSSIALVILSPLFLFLIIIVRFSIGRPAFFKQKRVGRNYKIFTIYKLRTMKDVRDGFGELLPDRERLTKIGKILRKSSLDELPQLINILIGQMSFIGPRPKTIYETLLLKGTPYIARNKLKPGLSGWSVIHGRNNLSNDKMLEYDLEHVKKNSFLLDIKIFFKTFNIVLRRVGITTEGHATFKHLAEYFVEIGDKSTEEVELIRQEAVKIENSKMKKLQIV